jgi:gamma-tubulin complex component 2
MMLLAGLCQSLESDDLPLDNSDATDDDDGLGGMAAELGLGGAGLKGLMKNLNAQDGLEGGGPILGGEVLGIMAERDAAMSG